MAKKVRKRATTMMKVRRMEMSPKSEKRGKEMKVTVPKMVALIKERRQNEE